MKFLLSLFLLISVSYSQFTFSSETNFEYNTTQGYYAGGEQIGELTYYAFIIRNVSNVRLYVLYVNPSTYAMSNAAAVVVTTGAINSANQDLNVIDSTHVILAYSGTGTDGFIETYSVSTDKSTLTPIDMLEHNGIYAEGHRLAKIDDTHYLMIYVDTNADGWAKVVVLDGSHQITVGDSVRFRDGTVSTGFTGYDMIIEEIGNTDVFAVSYNDGGVRMASISVDGSYNLSVDDDILIDSDGKWQSIIGLDDTHLIIAWNKVSTGQMKTFSINVSNEFTQIDSAQFATLVRTSNSYFDMIEFETHYLVEYGFINTTYTDGYIKSFDLDGSYNITAQADEFEWYHNYSTSPRTMWKVDATHVVIMATGYGEDGFAFCVETIPPAASGWSHTIDGVSSPTAINAVTDWTKVDGVE